MKPAHRHIAGKAAEELVARYLLKEGYEIEERNLRLGAFELDLVARQGEVIVIVEVRYRGAGAYQSALASIGPLKRIRIRRAGKRLWSQRYRRDPMVARMRFDVAAVSESSEGMALEYIRAAF
ncbi:MAG: YraN family protein [Polyangiaceae bacterium]|nr:YraN family protein [Polyangiaceae bacterium]